MKIDKGAMILYAVTDRTWLNGRSLTEQVEQAIRAGATLIQLREKDLDFDTFVAEAKKMKEVADRHHIPLIINDNIGVALAVGADGVHVGQSDMEAGDVRALLGEDKILGVSAQTVEQAIKAEKTGADYLGVGAVFSTSTKLDAQDVSFQTLKEICAAVAIPVVAIGGIHEKNILQLRGSGVDGVAVISAIFAKPDIYAAAKQLCALSKEMVTS